MRRLLLALGAALAAGAASAEMEPATPESQGVSSQAVLDFIDAAERVFDGSAAGHLHGFVIVRHGRVIAEGSWRPFDTLNETHMLYSHSKSFTSSAVGFLVDEGRLDLDERIVDVFPSEAPGKVSENLAQLRVRDLLTMNAGKDDHLLRDGGDWVREFLSKDFSRKPGTGFKYDSDATYMLAALVERRSGEEMMSFLRRKMFDRIGIDKAWTTRSPQGVPCGGWGMNMTTREIARFGQLFLQKGVWRGERILTPDWVSLATTRHTWSGWQDVGVKALGEGTDWEQGYGFQFWRCRHGAYRADGAAGQLTVVMPEADMVVSVHAGLDDMQRELDLIWEHLLPACRAEPLPADGPLQAKLADRLANLEIRPLSGGCPLAGGRYALKENPRGMKSFEFVRTKGDAVSCRLVTRAGEQRFSAGTRGWLPGVVRIDPEDYEWLGAYVGEHRVAASCGTDRDGNFRIRAYLTGDPGHLDFSIDRQGRLTGAFKAMNGCRLEAE